MVEVWGKRQPRGWDEFTLRDHDASLDAGEQVFSRASGFFILNSENGENKKILKMIYVLQF
jgi:hypothetical protein